MSKPLVCIGRGIECRFCHPYILNHELKPHINQISVLGTCLRMDKIAKENYLNILGHIERIKLLQERTKPYDLAGKQNCNYFTVK